MAKERLTAYLEGLVQGVGMRYHVRRLANELNLIGYVKNLSDGRVEIVAEGNKEALQSLLRAIENSSVGNITNIDITWDKAQENFSSFDIR